MKTYRTVNRSPGWIAADKRRDDALERIAVALEAQVTPELQDLAKKTAEIAYRAARTDEHAAAMRLDLARRQLKAFEATEVRPPHNMPQVTTPPTATSDPAGTSEQEQG